MSLVTVGTEEESKITSESEGRDWMVRREENTLEARITTSMGGDSRRYTAEAQRHRQLDGYRISVDQSEPIEK